MEQCTEIFKVFYGVCEIVKFYSFVEYCGRNCFPVSPLPLHAHKQKGTSERKLMGWKNIHYQGEIKRKKHCIRKPALIIVVLLTS
jgi:hypothetical protein